MKETIFTVVGLIIGIMILSAGIYYYFKDKSDLQSRKIYGITSLIGAVITVAMIIMLIA